ncbi:MAG: N-acetylmuramoyl-L-alanine amidase [Acutalibacteraceae bacterium]|nr:N-acetylmuramoyl-L-alanine amidase [Acutalibacteraceae bacterium]
MQLLFKRILPFTLLIMIMLSGCKKQQPVVQNTSDTSSSEIVYAQTFSPNEDASFDSGSVMTVSLTSSSDSLSVTATFNEEAITLTLEEAQENNTLFTYSGSFTLPEVKEDTDLGTIQFKCKKDNKEQSFESGNITVLAITESEPSESTPSQSTPSSRPQSTPVVDNKPYIAEVVYMPAETFNGDTVDDTSRPYNSYLPIGTVDQCGAAVIENKSVGKSYRLLRYGKRVYEKNITVYEGTLPETNTLSLDRFGTEGKYTVMSLFTDWKAPFNLELKNQTYKNYKNNWNVETVDFTYVEIKFMYCNSFADQIEIPDDNPLFSSCEVIPQGKDTIVRLYLKKQGGFYGFKAEYDEYDCLVLKFLEPSDIQQEENEYGYALYNKTIIIDVGHGGKDSGAIAPNGAYESHLNLSLANLIKNELVSIGANVIMTRSDDSFLSSDQRIADVYKMEADFIISVHRDSRNNSSSYYGYESFYYHPFSAPASKFIHSRIEESGLYRKTNGSAWHYFYLNRIGICPSVLTENGFISNPSDLQDMYNSEHQLACAKATVKGIIDYFLYQRK